MCFYLTGGGYQIPFDIVDVEVDDASDIPHLLQRIGKGKLLSGKYFICELLFFLLKNSAHKYFDHIDPVLSVFFFKEKEKNTHEKGDDKGCEHYGGIYFES